MALTRAYEEHEVPPEIRRIYAGIRVGFDLPFVPSIFKLAAGIPEYLKVLWKDLESVISSREFETGLAGAGDSPFGCCERSAFSQNLPNILRRHGAEDEVEDTFNRV